MEIKLINRAALAEVLGVSYKTTYKYTVRKDFPPAPKAEPQPAPEPEEKYSLSFRVVATAQQLRALRKFLDEQGIRFEKI